MRTRLAVFISIVQSIILVGHIFIYATWAIFWGGVATSSRVSIALGLLSLTFVTASLLGWYFHNPLVRLYYVLAAVWLGLSSYLLWAAVLCWLTLGLSAVMRLGWARQHIADALFGTAVLAALYGLANAWWLRVNHISVQLPNLPPQWRGRTAALVTDTHLGHIRNGRFIRRVLRRLTSLEPDVVFLAGDVYDGTAADFQKLAQPWKDFIAQRRQSSQSNIPEIVRSIRIREGHGAVENRYGDAAGISGGSQASTPVMEDDPFLGVYYILGNHEEFYSHAEYLPPLLQSGVRALNNEKVELDGLQLVGVQYRDAADPESYRQLLRSVELDPNRPSILLLHAPVRLHIAEEEGISLQLSGHTHGGQFFPYTWIAKRVWGKFIHGLQSIGKLQVFTSYGAGSWGPPMRVGTRPEIVLITFV